MVASRVSRAMRLFRQQYGSGPPLIIVHGLLGAGGNWATLARKTYGEHFTTYVVDLRNHGRSPHDDEFSYAAMGEDIVALMDEEGLSHAHILGHSMGGKLGMHLALEHAERVDRLIVADIAPRGYAVRHETIFNAFDSINPAVFESRQEIDSAMSSAIPDDGLRQFLLKNLDRDGEGYRWKINLAAIRKGYPDIIGAVESWNSFDGDVLFVAGGQSDYVSDADMPDIRALFPFAEMVHMPESGHWLHAENPALFSRLTLDFLLR